MSSAMIQSAARTRGWRAAALQRRPLHPFGRVAFHAQVGQQPQRLQTVEHRIGAVRAVIRQDQEIGETGGLVVGQPFQQEGRLVPDREDGENAHRLPRRRDGIALGRLPMS
jgi:hypothetical protein